MKHILFVMLMVGCGNPIPEVPMAKGETICIDNVFFEVLDTTAYPWVRMGPNTVCEMRENRPHTYVDFSKVASFQPNCICKYTAPCRKTCEDKVGESQEECLDLCMSAYHVQKAAEALEE